MLVKHFGFVRLCRLLQVFQCSYIPRSDLGFKRCCAIYFIFDTKMYIRGEYLNMLNVYVVKQVLVDYNPRRNILTT